MTIKHLPGLSHPPRKIHGTRSSRRLDYPVLEQAADAAVEAREDLADGAEIIERVALDTYDPERGHVGVVSERDRADLERGREWAWTAHLAGSAIIDQLDTAASPQRRPSSHDLG